MGLSYQLIYVCFQGCVNRKYGQIQDFRGEYTETDKIILPYLYF